MFLLRSRHSNEVALHCSRLSQDICPPTPTSFDIPATMTNATIASHCRPDGPGYLSSSCWNICYHFRSNVSLPRYLFRFRADSFVALVAHFSSPSDRTRSKTSQSRVWQNMLRASTPRLFQPVSTSSDPLTPFSPSASFYSFSEGTFPTCIKTPNHILLYLKLILKQLVQRRSNKRSARLPFQVLRQPTTTPLHIHFWQQQSWLHSRLLVLQLLSGRVSRAKRLKLALLEVSKYLFAVFAGIGIYQEFITGGIYDLCNSSFGFLRQDIVHARFSL